MKFIKKFLENQLHDILSEIKSISYILEDDGFYPSIFEIPDEYPSGEKYIKINIGTSPSRYSFSIELGLHIKNLESKDFYPRKRHELKNVLILNKIKGLEDFY